MEAVSSVPLRPCSLAPMTQPPDVGADSEQGRPRIEPERGGTAGLIMRLMRRVAPKHAEAAERESREWFIVCLECGTARSYAELGGIRYGARSSGKRTRLTCPTCGVKRWHAVERRRSAAAE
jgi:hypothetical protein